MYVYFNVYRLELLITCTSLTDIMNRKPEKAWDLYMKMETSADSFNLLQLIANDCYRVSGYKFLYTHVTVVCTTYNCS